MGQQQLSRMERLPTAVLLLRMEQALMLTGPKGAHQRADDHVYYGQTLAMDTSDTCSL